MTRISLSVTRECSNRCVFCAASGLPSDRPDVSALAERLRALRPGADEVVLTGGEPTLRADLPDIVAAARAAGFSRVGLQTNGCGLADAAFCDALAAAGLTDLHLSVHGAEPAVHDYHAGAQGAFARVLAALGSARARRWTVVATTVLTRSNYAVLVPVAKLLRLASAGAWTVAVPHASGAAAVAFDRVHPRLGLAVPAALQAVEAAQAQGLPAFVAGAPLCTLGPFASRALPSPARAFAPACAACPARPACPGVDPLYLARFRGDELTPRDAPAPVPLPAVARLFTGTGQRYEPPAEALPAALRAAVEAASPAVQPPPA